MGDVDAWLDGRQRPVSGAPLVVAQPELRFGCAEVALSSRSYEQVRVECAAR
jgi:hypothetical protein